MRLPECLEDLVLQYCAAHPCTREISGRSQVVEFRQADDVLTFFDSPHRVCHFGEKRDDGFLEDCGCSRVRYRKHVCFLHWHGFKRGESLCDQITHASTDHAALDNSECARRRFNGDTLQRFEDER